MEFVCNRRFTFTTGTRKQSRLRFSKNDVPEGSVLTPLLFNIYKYDLTVTFARKFSYADDLAILHYVSVANSLPQTVFRACICFDFADVFRKFIFIRCTLLAADSIGSSLPIAAQPYLLP